MSSAKNTITNQQVQHVAALANIPVSTNEESALADAFTETLAVIGKLSSVDVSGVEPTHQVTGLENITREDQIDTDSMFSQEQALANAKTHQGYFVVDRILDND